MKQPELGKKISEWRKAKGMTQEELVEKCNLNVRTIQRIEAGEVMPRSYTIKALMEALEIEWETSSEFEKASSSVFPKTPSKILLISILFGVLYLLSIFFEFGLDMAYIQKSISAINYIPYKIVIFIFYLIFMLPIFNIAWGLKSRWMKTGVCLLVIAKFVAYIVSFFVIANDSLNHQFSYMIPSMIPWGVGYILLGYQLTKIEISFPEEVKLIGILGIVSGFLILSIIGGILAPFTSFVFELGLLYIYFKLFNSKMVMA
ncbi:helix-turn-helix domain-containing protein [Algoriphagus sp. PAP.12]|uniref:helix-turn-helix domain-containing protein n=1 Tax=Algoriphagus sp. PAP.12 TaxID=2996678 RepID=UPI00227BBD67|nr:helix-turn-helix transcriptional regulator [Algoriphagus sp. PAP.12]